MGTEEDRKGFLDLGGRDMTEGKGMDREDKEMSGPEQFAHMRVSGREKGLYVSYRALR